MAPIMIAAQAAQGLPVVQFTDSFSGKCARFLFAAKRANGGWVRSSKERIA